MAVLRCWQQGVEREVCPLCVLLQKTEPTPMGLERHIPTTRLNLHPWGLKGTSQPPTLPTMVEPGTCSHQGGSSQLCSSLMQLNINHTNMWLVYCSASMMHVLKHNTGYARHGTAVLSTHSKMTSKSMSWVKPSSCLICRLKSSLPSGPERTRSLYTLPLTDTAMT